VDGDTSTRAGPATSFTDLRQAVRDGQDVAVTGTDGRRVKGRLVDVTASSIVVAPPRMFAWQKRNALVLPGSSVTTVTRRDSTWNGAVLGFAVGYVPVTVAACTGKHTQYDCDFGIILTGPMAGGLGTLICGFIDSRHNRTVYQGVNVARTSLQVVPIIGPQAIGARTTFRF
jgi:hypothetical protein